MNVIAIRGAFLFLTLLEWLIHYDITAQLSIKVSNLVVKSLQILLSLG